MNRSRLHDHTFQMILVSSLLIVGTAIGIYIGLNGLSKKLVILALGVPFLVITIYRPWIAVSLFFLLVPLEDLFVLGGGNTTATLNKLIGFYLVFLAVTSGSFRYINVAFNNKKSLLIILFGLISIFSIYFSKDPSYSIKYLIKLWLLIISYFVLILMIKNKQTLNYALFALIIGAVLSILSPLVFGYGNVASGKSVMERYGGLWGDQNEFAGMLLVLIPLCISFIFTSGKKNLKVIFSVFCAILFIGLLLTYSRSGFIAAGVMCVVAMFKFIRGKHRMRILAVVVPCLIIGFILIYYTVGNKIISRMETLRILESQESVHTETSLSVRYYYYFHLFPKLFAEHPLMGVGFRGFVLNNPVYKQISHNTFIEVLTGTGLLGFIPFVLILYMTWKDIRTVRTDLRTNKDSYYLTWCSNALEMGFISYLVVGLFYSLDINKILWLMITISSIFLNIKDPRVVSGRASEG